MEIYTIGHSTHTEEEFVSLLKKYEIEVLADVRSIPASRYVPQFNEKNMERWLPKEDIKYLHIKELGGRRNKNREIDVSLVNGWNNEAFRNYAAYSLTQEYEEGIDRLIKLSKESKVCCMCSEAVPWRCHRLIISNTLVSKGVSVYHIMTERSLIAHEIGMYGAEVIKRGSQLLYPKAEDEKV
jgi:uncharacterized protein (DUF488 family)